MCLEPREKIQLAERVPPGLNPLRLEGDFSGWSSFFSDGFVFGEVVHWLESQKCYTHASPSPLQLSMHYRPYQPPPNYQTSPPHTNAGQALCDVWRNTGALSEAHCWDAASRQR